MLVLIAVGFVWRGWGESHAQTPQSTPEVRALKAEVSELTQAWTGARTNMIAAQDQIDVLQTELDKTKAELAAQQAKAANAIAPPPLPHGTEPPPQK